MQIPGKLVLLAAGAVVLVVLLGMWLWSAFGVMSIPIDIILPLVAVRLARPLLDQYRL
jgi:biotin transporter BioY